MAITKNKTQLIDKALSLELELELDYYCDWWGYYYEDYNSDYYDDDRDPCWSYLESSDSDFIWVTYRYGKRLQKVYRAGRMIDMDTIYSKEKLRERKINQILGLELPTYVPYPTLGDIFPKEKWI